ncbi:hypothetical protein K438DRAFT_1975095 [Mycena galopus ATCC 62051]|nr:hypothetical protein K438DRAFT_1975095 [Mycena galopus ATCC 62051]
MHPASPATAENILGYTGLAANALQNIAVVAQTPFLNSVSTLSLTIIGLVEKTKIQKERYLRIVDGIHHSLCALMSLCMYSEEIRSPKLLEDIAHYAGTLQKLHSCLRAQRELGTFERFFKQSEINTQLDSCEGELRAALQIFTIKYGAVITSTLVELNADTEQRHQELLELISSQSVSSDNQSSSMQRSSLNISSTESLSLLPASPKIFHGRDSELKEIVDTLATDAPARITILGPGGMGKTTLAMAALHHPTLIEKYSLTHFISCESVDSCAELMTKIGLHLRLEPSRLLSKTIVHHFRQCGSCLLVLDNFETPWEPLESRRQVEEFLSLLADIPSLALLVTMRGAERPGKVKWTRPFLLPLEPLPTSASRQIFLEVAEDPKPGEESALDDLLGLSGSLPLAVSLMANIASFEGYSGALSRWQIENITLLSDGHDKQSNLEKSITLSLTSPRVSSSPHAKNLLSLLSLLPDGIKGENLIAGHVPIPDVRSAQALLIGTSLAYLNPKGRLTALSPIRDNPDRRQLLNEDFEIWIKDGVEYFGTGIRPIELAVSFYEAVAYHYTFRQIFNLQKAKEFCTLASALAQDAHDIKLQLRSLKAEYVIAHRCGELHRQLNIVHKARDLMRFTSDSSLGVHWIENEAVVNSEIGNMPRALDLCAQGEDILVSSGMRGSDRHLALLDIRAAVHFQKTEYEEARQLHEEISKETSSTSSPLFYANSLVSIAQLDVITGRPVAGILANMRTAEAIWQSFGTPRVLVSSLLTAELKLYCGDPENARTEFLKCLTKIRGLYPELRELCLAALGDPKHRMHSAKEILPWTITSLALVGKRKDLVGTSNALRRLADVHSILKEDETALSLFHAALDGGTNIGIHRLRAECMVGIGDIMLRRGDLVQAKEMWTGAYPLFVRSSRMKDAAAVEERLQQLPNTSLPFEPVPEAAATVEERLQQLPNTSLFNRPEPVPEAQRIQDSRLISAPVL